MPDPLETFKKKMSQIKSPSFKPGFSGRVMEAIAGAETPRFEAPDLTGALWRAFRPLALASAAACLLLFVFHTYRSSGSADLVDRIGPVAGARVEGLRDDGVRGKQAGTPVGELQEEPLTFEDWWGEINDQIYGGIL